MRAYLPVFLVFAACRGSYDDVNLNVLDPVWSVELRLDDDVGSAGTDLTYEVWFVSDQGDAEQTSADSLTSSLETLAWSPSTITPYVAGEHTLTAEVTHEGKVLVDTAVLDVEAGEAWVVDLWLSDHQLAAGDAVSWEITATDAWGNAVDVDTLPEADEAGLDIDATEITSTEPGVYTLTAASGNGVDAELLVVTPGVAAELTLTLSSEDLELYDTVHATVEVVDAYGNPTDDDWTLSSYGDVTTEIIGDNLTMWSEGWVTVRAEVDSDTSVYDEVGPMLIDSTGPDIDIVEPERGDWTTDSAYTVSGTAVDDWSTVTGVVVNGSSVTVGSDGSFSTELVSDFGMNVTETTATDSDGNTSEDVRALLAGDFLEYGDGASGGLLVRLAEGDGGLGALEAFGEDLVDSSTLDDLIPSPVYSDSSESCIDLGWFGKYCFTWYAVTLYVTNPYISGTGLDLDPTSAGVLDAEFAVYDPSLDWTAYMTVAEVDVNSSGDITADDITVLMELEPYVSGNQIYVDLNSVTASATNFDFDMDGYLDDVLDFFGVDVDGTVEDYLVDAIEGAVQDEVPALLEDALADLELGTDLTLGDNTYMLDAIPDDVEVDETGITLSMESTFIADAWVLDRTGLGSLYGDYSHPDFSSSTGMSLGLGLDFLNQALYALWGGGLLSMEMDQDDLGFDVADLEILFPDITALTIVMEPLLPPVLVPGTGTELLDMQLGDLHLTLYDGDASTGDVLLDVYVSMVIGTDIGATSDGTALTLELGELTLWTDVIEPEATSAGAAATESFLETLVPLLLPTLTDAVSELPMPSISGLELSGVTVELGGAEDGYTVLNGDLDL